MSYFKLLGYNVAKKLAGSANSLFSTAVISGSSSAPNLKDMVPSHASVATIEGFGGVPPIRPLETLHNALSLRQLDTFLDMMTSAPLFRTPASSPPKSGTSLSQQSFNGASVAPCDIDNSVRYVAPNPIRYKISCDTDTCDVRNQPSPTSPNSVGWSSEAQSFPSSEPSSPAPTSTGECSMSVSLISNDGTGTKFSATSGHFDLDFNDFYMNVDQESHESRGSVSYTDYYSNEDGQIRKGGSAFVATTSYAEDPPADSVDDDEEHTLTLRRAEELQKQNVKMLFEQQTQCAPPPSKMTFKKIGRFRVESMDISDEDVRIKESDRTSRTSTWRSNWEAQLSKRKSLSRSQSVSTPRASLSTCESDTFKCSCSKHSLSSSAFSTRDLEARNEPVLTVASSLTDCPSVTVGFDVRNDKDNSTSN